MMRKKIKKPIEYYYTKEELDNLIDNGVKIPKKRINHELGYLIGRKFNRYTILELVHKHDKPCYLCRCDCGNEKVCQFVDLFYGTVKSCGCLQKENQRLKLQKPKGFAAVTQLMISYKWAARTRGLLFDISRESFIEITSSNCFYCGSPPSKIKMRDRANGSYTYNGIDRLDSSKGYIKDNIVPCCSMCNVMKLHHDIDDFLNHIKKINSHIDETIKNLNSINPSIASKFL